ncbi:MAG: AbrB/MazE/SpoVT family DNA-binding domain-containing protein [Sulfolobales archaeon]
MPVVARTRIGRYYRTTVPREVRKLLELRENDEVEWFSRTEQSTLGKRRGEQRG